MTREARENPGRGHLTRERNAMSKNDWKPWIHLGDPEQTLQRIMELRGTTGRGGAFVHTPATDVFENEQGLTFVLELPGVPLENIRVEVRDGGLHVSGERVFSGQDVTYHALELGYGPFQRSFMLPSDADPESVSAVLKNGLLSVSLRRKRPVHRRITPE